MKIAQGAEAVISRTDEGIIKERVEKRYRHPELDRQLREQRTRAEARLLAKASRKGVRVPSVEKIDDSTLLMEDVGGRMVKEVLNDGPGLAEEIGEMVGQLHDAHLIHGDLTTSNMMLSEDKVVFIDFGLAFHSQRVEDKAVDLHVFKQALESKHHEVVEEALEQFFRGYQPKNAHEVLERLKEVERRGKNKGS